MNPETLLHRQVHPCFVQAGRVSSQAFKPSPKDEQYLSLYDGDLIGPEAAWVHYTVTLGLRSVGTLSLSLQECMAVRVPVVEDREPFPEHLSLDFTAYTRTEIEKIAKKLRDMATHRSWTFGPCELTA